MERHGAALYVQAGFHPSKEVFEVRRAYEYFGTGKGFHPSKEVFEARELDARKVRSLVSIPLRKFLR